MRQHAISLLFAFLLASTACSPKSGSIPIGDVTADPGRYGKKTVELEGEVTDAFGLLSLGVFTLSDSTGEISVLTGEGLPAVGARLKVRGEVLGGITVGGTHYGTSLQEDSRDYLE